MNRPRTREHFPRMKERGKRRKASDLYPRLEAMQEAAERASEAFMKLSGKFAAFTDSAPGGNGKRKRI